LPDELFWLVELADPMGPFARPTLSEQVLRIPADLLGAHLIPSNLCVNNISQKAVITIHAIGVMPTFGCISLPTVACILSMFSVHIYIYKYK